MKRIIALASVMCLMLSLCSCKIKANKDITIGVPTPPIEYKDAEYKEDFKDSTGTVIASLDFKYPEFSSSELPDIAKKINDYMITVREEAAEKIKLNLDNTADYKKRFNITDPTVTEVTFEMVENNTYYLSFWLNTKTGVDRSDIDGFTTGYTFSTLDGDRLGLSSLQKQGAEYNTDFIKVLIINEANKTYANGASLEEDKKQIMNEYFDPLGFCCTPEGLTFYYSYSAISGGSVKGIYECSITYELVYQMLMTPEQYYETYSE